MKSVFPGFAEFIRPGAPADIAKFKFRDSFAMPVGPRGAEMTRKLPALDGTLGVGNRKEGDNRISTVRQQPDPASASQASAPR